MINHPWLQAPALPDSGTNPLGHYHMTLETQNFLQYSEDLSQSMWTSYHVSASWADGWVALTDSDNTVQGSIYQPLTLPLEAGDVYTMSVEVKKQNVAPTSLPEFVIQYRPSDSALYARARLDPVTGAWGVSAYETAPTTQSVTVTDRGDAWHIALTFPVLSSGNTEVRATIKPSISSGDSVTAGATSAGVGTIHIRNLQFYAGSHVRYVSVPTTHKQLIYDYSGLGNDAWLGSNGGAAINPIAKYLWLPGTTGNYASTPDSTTINVPGDIDIRIKAATTWQTTRVGLASKWDDAAGQHSWVLTSESAGGINFYWFDGTTGVNYTQGANANVAFADGEVGYLRVTMQSDDGAGNKVFKFYISTTGTMWTQLGTTITTSGTTSVNSSTAALQLGTYNLGASSPLGGRIYSFQLHNGIDGPVVARFTPTDSPGDTNNFLSKATGETWTVYAASYVDAHDPVWVKDGLLLDGVTTYISGLPAITGDEFAVANEVFTFTATGYDTAGGFLGTFLAHSRYDSILTNTQADTAHESIVPMAARQGVIPNLDYLFRADATAGATFWGAYANGVTPPFSRSSTALGEGDIEVASGVLRVFGKYTQSPVILEETQRTNIVSNSDQGNYFSHYPSYLTNTVISTGGAYNLGQVKHTITDTRFNTDYVAFGGPFATNYDASSFLWLKGEGSSIGKTMRFYVRAVSYGTSNTDGTQRLYNSDIVSVVLTSGWQKVGVSGFASSISSYTTQFDRIDVLVNTFTATGAWVVGESFYVSGFQFENAKFSSSYIPTSGATATRNNDSFQFTNPYVGGTLVGTTFHVATRNSTGVPQIYPGGNQNLITTFGPDPSDGNNYHYPFEVSRNSVGSNLARLRIEDSAHTAYHASNADSVYDEYGWNIITVTVEATQASIYIASSLGAAQDTATYPDLSNVWRDFEVGRGCDMYFSLGAKDLGIPLIDNRVWTPTEISNAHTEWLAELNKITTLL